MLCVQAGGRCEFDGCNTYLFEDALTHKRFNFAQMAHVVAFSEQGPRGGEPRPADINDIENLMLLCHPHHKLIDDHPLEYTRETLEGYKKAHEDRICLLTSMAPDRHTTAVILMSRMGDQIVRVSSEDIISAVAPRYPSTRNGVPIDLTSIPDEGCEFYKIAAKKIRRDLANVQDTLMSAERTNHISLFALAPMPLLVLAGTLLSNKVACDLYQRHRDTQDWKWKTDGKPAGFTFAHIREGNRKTDVAVIMSLSGKVHRPTDLSPNIAIYEVTLEGQAPNPSFLRQREDVTRFEYTYQQLLREIGTRHGEVERIHLFPAVPAPIAVACGRELMPKKDPVIVVYDDDKRYGGFRRILEVNN